jgi:hypothetical protein
VQDIELHDDTIELGLVELQADFLQVSGPALAIKGCSHLHRHHDACWPVVDLLYRAVIALAELSNHVQLVHIDLEARTIRKIDAFGGEDCFRREFEGTGRVPVFCQPNDPGRKPGAYMI